MKPIVICVATDLGVHIDGSSIGAKQLLNDIKSFYKDEVIELSQPTDMIKSHNLSDRRKNQPEIEKLNTEVYKNIFEKTQNLFPIVIGGDMSVSIASTMAEVKKNLGNIGVICISGHANYETFDSTGNGNIEEMSIAAINGYKTKDLTYFHDGNMILNTKTAIVGARYINEAQNENLRYSGVKVFDCDDLKDRGAKRVLDDAFNIAFNKTEGVHVILSLDVLDPIVAPGISSPVFDGLQEDEMNDLLVELLKRIEDITSIDLVDFNPLRDDNRKTEQMAVNYLAQIIKIVQTKGKNFTRRY